MKRYDDQTVRLRELAVQVARRWPVLLATLILVTAVSLAAAGQVKPEYTATASLTVSPLTTNPFSTAAVNQQINITTERAILESNEVARMASEELGGGPAPDALLNRVDVAAPSGSQVLEVSVTMANPQEAADYANAMAKAYLQFRAKGATDLAAGYITALNEEIARLQAVPAPTEQQAQRLSEAVQQRTNFTLVADSPGRIIGVAAPPSQPSSLSRSYFLVGGLIGGLLLGIIAAILRERTDGKVRTTTRLAEACNVSALKVTDEDDAEGMRWILRSLSPLIDSRKNGPALVGVMPVSKKSAAPSGFADGFTDGLAKVARAAGLSPLVIKPEDVDPDMIDQGWPGSGATGWHRRDLVIIETDQQIAGTRRARLADHLGSVVVVAGANSSLKDVRRLVSDLGRSPAARVPVLLAKGFGARDRNGLEEASLLTLPSSIPDEDEAERKERA